MAPRLAKLRDDDSWIDTSLVFVLMWHAVQQLLRRLYSNFVESYACFSG